MTRLPLNIPARKRINPNGGTPAQRVEGKASRQKQTLTIPTVGVDFETADHLKVEGNLGRHIEELRGSYTNNEEKYRDARKIGIAVRYAEAQEIYKDPLLFEEFAALPGTKCKKPKDVLKAYFKITIPDDRNASRDRRRVDRFWPNTVVRIVLADLRRYGLQKATNKKAATGNQTSQLVVIPSSMVKPGSAPENGQVVSFIGVVASVSRGGAAAIRLTATSADWLAIPDKKSTVVGNRSK